MNQKIRKLYTERRKNETRIQNLSERNREIDETIKQLENNEIVGLVRATGMNLEQLAVYLKTLRKGEMPFAIQSESEDTADESKG